MEQAVVSSNAAERMLRLCGLHLLLGFHPRANLSLAMSLALDALRGGRRVAVMDCDHTVNLDLDRELLEAMKGFLLSRPEGLEELESDLRAVIDMDDLGLAVINRPSSLVESSELTKRFEEKKRLWVRLGKLLRDLANVVPLVVLEDSRHYEDVEYKVHPALYYLSRTVLEAVEDGKDVQQYRILKNRPLRA